MEQRSTSPFLLFLPPLLVSLALIIGGVVLLTNDNPNGWTLIGTGVTTSILTFLIWHLYAAVEDTRRDARATADAFSRALIERLTRFDDTLLRIADQQLISERAKQVAYRHKDIETLRRAIREHIQRDEFDAAGSLANDLETGMHAPAEAAAIRKEIATKRQESQQRRTTAAVAKLDEMCRAERWTEARVEADRLTSENPDVPQMQMLAQEVSVRREAFKRTLRDSWHEAAYRRDVDTSITLLRRLDPYLTPQEAEQMEETVRGIFREKMTTLRAEFTSAVQQERWPDAARIGESIIRDFPNARIAQEVRETMSMVRQRAGLPPVPTVESLTPPLPQRPASPLERAAVEAANQA